MCHFRNCLDEFSVFSEISLDCWEICSSILRLFSVNFKLRRIDVKLFYLGPYVMVFKNPKQLLMKSKSEHAT